MLVLRHKERQTGPNILSVSSVSLHAYCTSIRERERERGTPEYIVNIECFCTCMLYVMTREREREARMYCQYRVFLYMHVVRHNVRERDPNILSVSCVSVHANCTS